MSDPTTSGRCASCGRPAEYHCDQCGEPLCAAHRVVVEGGLGSWSRCKRCNLRNKIRESPLIRYGRGVREVRWFLTLIWFLVVAAVVLAVFFGRALLGPAPGPR